jgi:hypothetical protein
MRMKTHDGAVPGCTRFVIASGLGPAAGSFGPAYGTYLAFTLVFAALATLPVTCIAQGGLADGGGISELKVCCRR